MLGITVIVTLTGLVNRFSRVDAESNLALGSNIGGLDDLLQQGGSIETVLLHDATEPNVETSSHTVESGETLEIIAEQYDVSADTIRWANLDVINPFTDKLEVGSELKIPAINGVFYTVKSGQNLDAVISEVSINNDEANRFNIIEFNNLKEPYTLAVGQKLFIPDGNLKKVSIPGGSLDIPVGVFIDPLSNSGCFGYTYSRGFLSYHDGVDLARYPTCPIEAVANGVVRYAGWSSAGQGYNVEIDHGGGIVTKYFHGDGTFWVKTGDYVKQGQPIMQMGCTGLCTGTHLHFSLWKNGISIDPAPFVPYWRPE